MARFEVPVVFNVEEEPPVPLGIYRGTEEDSVLYTDPYGFRKIAPRGLRQGRCGRREGAVRTRIYLRRRAA
jgi:hypothetical protein